MLNLPFLLKANASGMYLSLYVSASARRLEVVGIHGDAIKIRVSCPPVDGRANKEVCKFFSTQLEISLSCLTIVAGKSSRKKQLFIAETVLKKQEDLILKLKEIVSENEKD